MRQASMVAAVALAVAAAPAAAGTTGVLGNPGPYPGGSTCADGSFVTSLHITYDYRDYVDSVRATCSGDQPSSGTIGFGWYASGGGESTCAADDIANGIYGRAGDIVDAAGLGCLNNDGAQVGGGGGAVSVLDCPAGERLSGLRGTATFYAGDPVVASLQGICVPFRPTTREDCADGGWQKYGAAYRNQGECVSAVTPQPSPPSTGTTGVLGNPGTYSGESTCGDGTFVTALVASYDFRNYVDRVAAQCSDGSAADGAIGPGSNPYRDGSGVSACSDGDLATGIVGRFGDIADAVGLGCQGTDGTLVGGGGGEPRALDCSPGWRVVGVRGTWTSYFGGPAVASMEGVCVPYEPQSAADCRNEGWRRYGGRFANQGDCVSTVESQPHRTA